MHRTIGRSLLPCIVIMFMACAATASTAATRAPSAPRVTPTSGAVRLNASQRKQVERTTCGRIGTAWRSGQQIGNAFLSDLQRAANYRTLAEKRSGTAAKSLRRMGAAFAARHSAGVVPCRQPNGAYRAATIKSINGLWCGSSRSGGLLVPGAASGPYFTSYTQFATNTRVAARFASKLAAPRLRASAVKYDRLAREQSAGCLEHVGTPNPPPNPMPNPLPASPLRFDLTGAIGLAHETYTGQWTINGPNVGPAFSNLRVVGADGSTRDAVVSGRALIGRVWAIDGHDVYVSFEPEVDLSNTSDTRHTTCHLATVSRASGVPTCIDSAEGTYIRSLQTDTAGALYYTTSTGSIPDGTFTRVIRRADASGVVDLVSSSEEILEYAVSPDGTLFYSRLVDGAGVPVLWRRSTAGQVERLSSESFQLFPRFPDGNIYFSTYSGTVDRYLTASAAVDPIHWVGPAAESHHDAASCPWGCIPSIALVTTSNDEVLGFRDWEGEGHLTEVYPTPRNLPSTIVDGTLIETAGEVALVAGTDAAGHHVLTRYDTFDDSETVVIDATHANDISHLALRPRTDQVLFDGRRISDGEHVVGAVDVTTGAVTTLAIVSGTWDDLVALD